MKKRLGMFEFEEGMFYIYLEIIKNQLNASGQQNNQHALTLLLAEIKGTKHRSLL